MIKSENDITGAWARARREQLGLSQSNFWGAACVSKAMASMYENGRPVPAKVRRLMYLRHVVGIPVDGDLSDLRGMAANLRQLASANKRARHRLNKAADLAQQVGADIGSVIAALEGSDNEENQ